MNSKKSEERICFRCGKVLQAGSLSYIVNIRVFSDFDGVLIEPEEGIDKHLENLLRQVESLSAEELEKDVYEEFTLILCKSCRDRFVHETKNPWEGPFKLTGKSGSKPH